MKKRVTYGMVGGSLDAFIGDAHRRAIRIDGMADLAAGCFSRSWDKTLQTGEELGLETDRLYHSYEEMAEKESSRPDPIDFVVIVTPNDAHYAACRAFLEAGISVVCDKPLCTSAEEAAELEALAKEKGLLFMVTYTYSGHVTVRDIREKIRQGEIGEIRMVMAEYPQGWLAKEDVSGNKQAEWRIDPDRSGATNCLGDIGTHIEHTVLWMTGLRIRRLLAKMDRIVPGRRLDDNTTVMVEYDNGASGCYWASQIAIGHDNGLRVRIYGSKGSILWFQENPEIYQIFREDGTIQEVHRGHACISERAAGYQRLPSGHTEGWLEAMANLYRSYTVCIEALREGRLESSMIDFPTVSDGADGVRYIEACLASQKDGGAWIDCDLR